jgi:hypothetical protein
MFGSSGAEAELSVGLRTLDCGRVEYMSGVAAIYLKTLAWGVSMRGGRRGASLVVPTCRRTCSAVFMDAAEFEKGRPIKLSSRTVMAAPQEQRRWAGMMLVQRAFREYRAMAKRRCD